MKADGQGQLGSSGETVLYSGHDDGQLHEGEAIVMKKGIEKSRMEWRPIHNRWVMARLKGKQVSMTIFQCYAPSNYTNEDAKMIHCMSNFIVN